MIVSIMCDCGTECFKHLLSQLPIPVVITGFENGRIHYLNGHAESLFRVSAGEALSHNAVDFYMEPVRRKEFLSKLEKKGVFEGFEIECKDADGSRFWAMLSSKRIAFDGNDSILSTFTDITKSKRLEQELLYTSRHDHLTGAYNRRHFLTSLEMEISRARRYGEKLSMLMLDVDKFKDVNDGYGHLVGDEVLKWLVALVKPLLRQMDVLSRVGGEEFVVLLPETNLEGALHVGERIRSSFAETLFKTKSISLGITVSMGVACLDDSDDADGFYKRTDDALLEAKSSGRNRVVTG
jgi:diguanylate cyclase (GGDEF)-like protein/PAS domain S-box-containing protein